MTRIKETIRLYQPNDPYYYKVDNLPLEDLLDNDKALQDQLDSLEFSTEVDRSGFIDLKPYVDSGNPGKVFVKPGNFISRIQTAYTRHTGDREKDYSDPMGAIDAVEYDPNGDAARGYGIGRTALIRFLQAAGEDQFVSPESFRSGDFEGDAPAGRLDLVFIRGNGSLDSLTNPKLGIIKGGGLTTLFTKEQNGTRWSDWVSGGVGTKGKSGGMSNADIPQNSKGLNSDTELEPEFGTIPLPDDLINFAIHKDLAYTTIQEWVDANKAGGAAFGIPICYVFIPNTYRAGDKIDPSYIIDIRPFFRSAELTIDERQAIVGTGERPSVSNPFTTRKELEDKISGYVDRLEALENSTVQRHYRHLNPPEIMNRPSNGIKTVTKDLWEIGTPDPVKLVLKIQIRTRKYDAGVTTVSYRLDGESSWTDIATSQSTGGTAEEQTVITVWPTINLHPTTKEFDLKVAGLPPTKSRVQVSVMYIISEDPILPR